MILRNCQATHLEESPFSSKDDFWLDSHRYGYALARGSLELIHVNDSVPILILCILHLIFRIITLRVVALSLRVLEPLQRLLIKQRHVLVESVGRCERVDAKGRVILGTLLDLLFRKRLLFARTTSLRGGFFAELLLTEISSRPRLRSGTRR